MVSNFGSAVQDQIIKGNEDITDAAQDEHRRLLAEKELRARFPEYFSASTEPLDTPTFSAT